jgi:hypothetical protein
LPYDSVGVGGGGGVSSSKDANVSSTLFLLLSLSWLLTSIKSLVKACDLRWALFYKSDEDGRQIDNNMDKPSEAVLTLQVVMTLMALPLTVDATGKIARAFDL